MKKLLTLLLAVPMLAFAGNPKTIELDAKTTMSFNQAFSGSYIAKKQVEAITLCNNNEGSEINIVLYTPGGSIAAGKLFYDTLKALPCTFNTITIFAASMGYQTVQNLGKRYILPSGILMSHRASIRGLGGEVNGELDSIYNLIKKDVEELEIIASNRVGITLEDYRKAISDELWMTASEAVKSNHADEVVLVKCGKSLLGTKVETVYTMFGAFEVEFSECPIITSPLRVLGASRGIPTDIVDYYSNIKKHVFLTR